MFTACTHEDIILQLFPNPSGHMHVIVATIAFAMGLYTVQMSAVLFTGDYHPMSSPTSKKQEGLAEMVYQPWQFYVILDKTWQKHA